MILPVTLVIAAAAGLINIWLATRASAVRIKDKVEMGDGGNPLLLARMRAHANFTEYTPFVLILIALIELARGPSPWLWGVGAIYLLARVAHAFGMERPVPNPFRLTGILVTLLTLLGLSVWAIVIGYGAGAAAPAPTSVELIAPKA